MTRWSQAELDAYLAKQELASQEFGEELCEAVDPGPESRLQGKIEAWCKEWGRPCLSFRQSKAAKRMLPAGWPDMEIIMPKGETLRLELKAGKKDLSGDQKRLKLQFMALGHVVHKVKSFRKFLELVNKTKEDNRNESSL